MIEFIMKRIFCVPVRKEIIIIDIQIIQRQSVEYLSGIQCYIVYQSWHWAPLTAQIRLFNTIVLSDEFFGNALYGIKRFCLICGIELLGSGLALWIPRNWYIISL